jgi:Putative Actinobacterial Holin-X, holin superfamily III
MERMSAYERPKLGRAARLVADRAAGVGRLTAELAFAEVKQKLAALGAGIGLLAGAAFLVVFAVGFVLAAAAAALTLVVSTWAALLIVAGGLLLVGGVLAALGVGLLRKGSPPVPEKALAETKRTAEVLRNGR